jgi:hypothetical protein
MYVLTNSKTNLPKHGVL